MDNNTETKWLTRTEVIASRLSCGLFLFEHLAIKTRGFKKSLKTFSVLRLFWDFVVHKLSKRVVFVTDKSQKTGHKVVFASVNRLVVRH